jgi:predicted ATPase
MHMVDCDCQLPHAAKRIVVTGGPGAGKTAVLELIRQHFCRHVDVLPEAASILFLGGFRRGTSHRARAAAQRAIFRVQRELEAVADADSDGAIVLCDRGTLDGVAYWPAEGDFFLAMGTQREAELKRYHAVLHLRTPARTSGYDQRNPVRIETAEEAAVIDARIAEAWAGHPRRWFVDSTGDFMAKAQRAIGLLRGEMPPCCRAHVVPAD